MLLGVNIDHIATLRNARGGTEPSLLVAAHICQKLDVFGVTVHLREDRRHIKDFDLAELSQIDNLKINLEMAATQEMVEIALRHKPHSCCIVPEKRQEITTEGGLDVIANFEKIKTIIDKLHTAGILVSLFIDPKKSQVETAAKCKADYIEMHTGAYANAFGTTNEETEFQKLKNAAVLAQSLGLKVNAGHGLNYQNVKRMHEIPHLQELNIGHSIVSTAIYTGFEAAVKEMKNLALDANYENPDWAKFFEY